MTTVNDFAGRINQGSGKALQSAEPAAVLTFAQCSALLGLPLSQTAATHPSPCDRDEMLLKARKWARLMAGTIAPCERHDLNRHALKATDGIFEHYRLTHETQPDLYDAVYWQVIEELAYVLHERAIKFVTTKHDGCDRPVVA